MSKQHNNCQLYCALLTHHLHGIYGCKVSLKFYCCLEFREDESFKVREKEKDLRLLLCV